MGNRKSLHKQGNNSRKPETKQKITRGQNYTTEQATDLSMNKGTQGMKHKTQKTEDKP